MRYLNKIIFINSAAIPYSEIKLDGNIHFIGTQGVGKSTILRAILYFYNADSRQLGIPKGPTVKSFADWYLKHSNSYLIYEVMRETGAFCVVAFKQQNRVCYRFIDSAYRAEYFINDRHEAHASWESIREKLDAYRINISTLVNSYDQYRDILYGNFTGKKEFAKYALLEAKQYRNIYRTIQNVFLNTKLDANEIKQTIISSMEAEQISIDLDKYSIHLNGFETVLNDIRKFRFPSVQRNAEQAILQLSAIRHLSREQNLLAEQLKFRLEEMTEAKPKLESQKRHEEEKLNAENRSFAHERQLFDNRRTKILNNISQLEGKLKDSARQKKYYDSLNIAEIIRRVNDREDKQIELHSLQNERHLLTNQFGDLNSKYDALVKEQEQQLTAFLHQKEAQKLEVNRELTLFAQNLQKEYEKLLLALEEEHESEMKAAEDEVSMRRNEVHRLEKQAIATKHRTFYADELALLDKTKAEAEITKQKEQNHIESTKAQIKSLQTKWEYENKEADKNCESALEKLNDALASCTQKRNELELKINANQDSLYAWLNSNKPGWENTIGKIMSEETLFRCELSPKLLTDSESCYGLGINLNEIDPQIKSMEDYRFELDKLDKQMANLQQCVREETQELEKTKEKIQRRNLPKIKELKENARQADYIVEQRTRQIEQCELKHNLLLEKAAMEQKQALESIQIEIDKAMLLLDDSTKKQEDCKGKLRKNKENKLRERTRRVNDFEKECSQKTSDIDAQEHEKRTQIAVQITLLKKERDSELQLKGSDTKRLSEVEKQIAITEEELKYIDKNRDKVSDYQKDKRELFDKEKDFKNEIASQESLQTKIQQEFALTEKTWLSRCEQIKLLLKRNETELDAIKADEDKYQKNQKSTALSYFESNRTQLQAAKNELCAIDLIDLIIQNESARTTKNQELRVHLEKFLSHFSDGNIFNFPSKLIEAEEYLNWAEELNDFIEEGKINEFEKRTNERFAYIINTIGNDITTLISKAGEIKKIIRKINADFKQKNFVTAINNIELDISDSKNSAVLLLMKIKTFNDENAMSIGTMNLFSGTDNEKNNEQAVVLLKQLVKEINQSSHSLIQLSDSFELAFRIEENGNDTGWQEKLTNVGSEGTDVLVKAMINIMLLNVFKEGASRKFKDFQLHCMMDEIGKLHPTNVRGILKFANDRNILLINGSPTENTPLNYRHIYRISKDEQKQTSVKRIISNPPL